jgi:hypothetical protein
MLLVYHTPAVHAEIDDFLRSMKKSLPTTRTTAKATGFSGLAQMGYSVPLVEAQAVPAYAPPAPATAPGYPVAAPTQQPHHLFHFIIRYEGDGIIDHNVAELAKSYGAAVAASATEAVKAAPADPANAKTVVAPASGDAPAHSTAPDTLPSLPSAQPTSGSSGTESRAATPSRPAPVTPPATDDDDKE